MGLEDGTYLNDLNPNNPVSTDKRREGDDHLRLLKTVLLNTFPNINFVVNASEEEMNHLVGVNDLIQDQLDTKLEASDLPALGGYAQLAVINAWTKPQAISPVALGNRSGSTVIDCRTGSCFTLTLIGNLTLDFNNLIEGQEVTLKISQDVAGGRSITWSPTAHFLGKVAPSLSNAASAYDIVAGKVIDGKIIFGFLGDLGSV